MIVGKTLSLIIVNAVVKKADANRESLMNELNADFNGICHPLE